jgi:hypothetical protein
VKSECDVAGLFKRDIKHRQQLVVQQRMLSPITDIRTECTEKVTCCCCVNKGTAHLKAHVDKSHYVPGETVRRLFLRTRLLQFGFDMDLGVFMLTFDA